MPDNVTYLSITSYIEQTHDYYYHCLTAWQGELPRQNIEVRIVDDATDDGVFSESMLTFDQGIRWILGSL